MRAEWVICSVCAIRMCEGEYESGLQLECVIGKWEQCAAADVWNMKVAWSEIESIDGDKK